jgi:hypothetical protein
MLLAFFVVQFLDAQRALFSNSKCAGVFAQARMCSGTVVKCPEVVLGCQSFNAQHEADLCCNAVFFFCGLFLGDIVGCPEGFFWQSFI